MSGITLARSTVRAARTQLENTALLTGELRERRAQLLAELARVENGLTDLLNEWRVVVRRVEPGSEL